MARQKSRRLFGLKIGLHLGLAVIIYALVWGSHRFNNQYPIIGTQSGSVIVQLSDGATLASIASALSDSGIISSARLFVWGARLSGLGTALKAGEYAFDRPMSMREVLTKLSLGQVVEHRLTVPEGLTSAAVVALLVSDDRLSGTIVLTVLEGTILPETYLIRRGDDRETVLKRMRDAQIELLDTEWELSAETRPALTRVEIVNLASIVERETAVGEERAHIAGVFLNRLRRGMKLQSDPTVRYGLILDGKMAAGSSRPLLRSELAWPSTYNTYVHTGLPPGPIANPGAAAIRAVLRPLATPDLYFVASGNGGHAFAGTLAEHEENVRHWRSIEHMAD